RIRAVTGRTIGREDRTTVFERLGIARELVDRLAGIGCQCLCDLGLLDFAVGVVLLDRRPAAGTRKASGAGVPDQVADREDDGQVEQVDPPARQRLVVLADVSVPDMPGGFWFARATLRRPPEQPDT